MLQYANEMTVQIRGKTKKWRARKHQNLNKNNAHKDFPGGGTSPDRMSEETSAHLVLLSQQRGALTL